MNRPKVEWVAGYHDSGNYLLFSLNHDGLSMTSFVAGKRQQVVTRVPAAIDGAYSLMVVVEPGHVVIFSLQAGAWKQLDDRTGLTQDLDQGGFGFKGFVSLTGFAFSR